MERRRQHIRDSRDFILNASSRDSWLMSGIGCLHLFALMCFCNRFMHWSCTKKGACASLSGILGPSVSNNSMIVVPAANPDRDAFLHTYTYTDTSTSTLLHFVFILWHMI